VDVIAPVVVAALVSGNDSVAVINGVDEHATCDWSGYVALLTIVRVHDVVPVHERG
jgi:hypothetical protein